MYFRDQERLCVFFIACVDFTSRLHILHFISQSIDDELSWWLGLFVSVSHITNVLCFLQQSTRRRTSPSIYHTFFGRT